MTAPTSSPSHAIHSVDSVVKKSPLRGGVVGFIATVTGFIGLYGTPRHGAIATVASGASAVIAFSGAYVVGRAIYAADSHWAWPTLVSVLAFVLSASLTLTWMRDAGFHAGMSDAASRSLLIETGALVWLGLSLSFVAIVIVLIGARLTAAAERAYNWYVHTDREVTKWR